jgi:NADH:ubiquinone oxidoreductase subunit F (NADH-binding)
MGVSINEIVYDVCGGIVGGRKLKAVQMGGPSGG